MPTTKPAPAASTKSPRRPKQERGRDTVANIIGAARSLLRRLPLDDITTTRIARKAGVSIGGLYRFFPDKQSIVDAIAVHHVRAFRELVQTSIIGPLLAEPQNFETFDPAVVLNNMIDTYVIYLDTHPDFRAIAFGRHISAATHARESSPTTGLPALIKDFMLEQLCIPNTPELDLRLRVISQAGERLIAYAFQQPTVNDRVRIIADELFLDLLSTKAEPPFSGPQPLLPAIPKDLRFYTPKACPVLRSKSGIIPEAPALSLPFA